MASGSKEKKKFKEKLKDTYRILVIDVEDLKEVGNYQFTMARLYTYIISTVLIFSFLLVSLIVFTPLKRLMPGYGDIEENYKFVELRNKMSELEADLEDQIVYTQGLQNMLSGQNLDDLELPSNLKKQEKNQEDKTSAVVFSDNELKETKITRSLNNQYFVPPLTGKISAPFNRIKNHLCTSIIAHYSKTQEIK